MDAERRGSSLHACLIRLQTRGVNSMLDQDILLEKGVVLCTKQNMKIEVYYMLGNNTVYLYVINRH